MSARFTSFIFPFTLFVTVTWQLADSVFPLSVVIVAVTVTVPSAPPAKFP